MRSHSLARPPAPTLAAALLLVLPQASAAELERQTAAPVPQEAQGSTIDIQRMRRPINGIDSVRIEELTWLEVRDGLADGKTVAIVPTGAAVQP